MATEPIIVELEEFLTTKPTQQEVEAWIAKLPPHEKCMCSVHMLRLSRHGFTRVMDMQYVFKGADLLSDEELFRQLAGAVNDTLKITPAGKIGMLNPREHPEPISRFASLYNEAVRRGFQRDDIGIGIKGYSKSLDKLEPFRKEPVWQEFEKLTARIHVAFCRNAEVKWSEKLKDDSGTERQIDVTVRSKVGPHNVLAIVSCKCEKRPVSIIDVEAFITTKNDLKAAMGIVVSRSGYQDGAIAKAKNHDIRLWTLAEAEEAAWRHEVRIFDLFYPMCSEFKFIPALPPNVFPTNIRLEFADVVFISPDEKRQSLQDVIAIAIDQACQRCLPVPCWLDMIFPDGSTINFYGKSFPVQKMEFHFTHNVQVRQQKQMRIPTGPLYNFNQAPNGTTYKIAERDLPPLKEE
jgi:hypothetical protein